MRQSLREQPVRADADVHRMMVKKPPKSQSIRLPFDADAVRWVAVRLDPAMLLDGKWGAPDWSADRRAIADLLGIDRKTHFLNQPPGVFPKLPEPQITRALRALLLNAPERTLERAQALFDALVGTKVPRLSSIERVTADDETRMDLAIHAVDRRGIARCLVVEAKFEYELSGTQLAKYRRRLLTAYPRADRRHLFVVAPRKTSRTAEVLARPANAEWRFFTWRKLLVEWQRALPEQPGGDVANLFGEIWKRAGGR